MPTGYTAKLMEEGQSFEEFILERFEPSQFYVEKEMEAKATLEKLEGMSPDEQMEYGEDERARRIAERVKWLQKEIEENDALAQMRDQAAMWTPPSPDHVGLKEFMLDQLDISRHDVSWIRRDIDALTAKAPILFYIDDLKEAKDSVQRYADEYEKEVDRVEMRNEWLKKLRESIK